MNTSAQLEIDLISQVKLATFSSIISGSFRFSSASTQLISTPANVLIAFLSSGIGFSKIGWISKINLILVTELKPSRSVRVTSTDRFLDSVKLKNWNWRLSESNLEKVSSMPWIWRSIVSSPFSSLMPGRVKFIPGSFGNYLKTFSSSISSTNKGAMFVISCISS